MRGMRMQKSTSTPKKYSLPLKKTAFSALQYTKDLLFSTVGAFIFATHPPIAKHTFFGIMFQWGSLCSQRKMFSCFGYAFDYIENDQFFCTRTVHALNCMPTCARAPFLLL